jgi:hypothetical protein
VLRNRLPQDALCNKGAAGMPPRQLRGSRAKLDQQQQQSPTKARQHAAVMQHAAHAAESMAALLIAADSDGTGDRDLDAYDGKQLLACYTRLLGSILASSCTDDTTLLQRLRNIHRQPLNTEANDVLEALHARIDHIELFRCENCFRYIAPGIEFDAPAVEWTERSKRWALARESLEQLWRTALQAAVATVSAQVSSAQPRYGVIVELLTALGRLLPSIRELAMTGEADNLRWRKLCGTSMRKSHEASAAAAAAGGSTVVTEAAAAEATWLDLIGRMYGLLAQAPLDAKPRALLSLQLRRLEVGLRSVPDLSQPASLFVSTGRAILGAAAAIANPTLDASLHHGLRGPLNAAWETADQRECIRVYEALASLAEASAIMRAALQMDPAGPSARQIRAEIPKLLGALHRVYVDEAACLVAADFARLLADVLLAVGSVIQAVPDALINVVCFGSESAETGHSRDRLLSSSGAIVGLLRHGDEQLPVELQSATIRLLRWACSVCEGQLNVWVKKGFAILNECLAQSFAALADDLSDELPSLVKLLRKSGLDNTEGSEGLVSKAQQAPLASFLNMAGDEPWEALAVTLMGVAEHLESMLRRTFGRAQQDAEAMWPLLTRAHEMLAALYESGKRVYSRERSLTVDLTSLVLDCVNSYRFEPRPTRWQLDKNHSSDQGVPTITAPLEWQSSPHHRETHRLGRPVYSLAGQDISNVFPVVQIDGSEPPMERFFELITTYNRGHERGQACWKDLEARVLEQVQNALLKLRDEPSDELIHLHEHGTQRDEPGGRHRCLRVDAGPRWIATRLEVLESALNYLEWRIDEECNRGNSCEVPDGLPASDDNHQSLASPQTSSIPSASKHPDVSHGAVLRLKNLYGLFRMPKSVEYEAGRLHEAWLPVSAGPKHDISQLDATIDAYRQATWEAANGHLWDTSIQRLEEEQLKEWREHFAWLYERQAKESSDLEAAHQARLLIVYGEVLDQSCVTALDEEQAAHPAAARALVQEHETTLASEVAEWTQHQARVRHEAVGQLVGALKMHCRHIRWQMSQLRPALARSTVLVLLPPMRDIEPLGSEDEKTRRSLQLQMMRGASQLTPERWAELARYSRPLAGLQDLGEYAANGRDANVILDAVRALMRTNSVMDTTDSWQSTIARWRQTLHSHFWEALEVVPFGLYAKSNEGSQLSHEYSLGPEMASLFWQRRQPVHRTLEGAAARVCYCLESHSMRAQTAAAAVHEVLGQQLASTREAYELCRDQVARSLEPLGHEHRAALIEKLTALSATVVVIQQSLLSTTKSPAPVFSIGEPLLHASGNRTRRESDQRTLETCTASLDISVKMSQQVLSAFLSVSRQSYEELAPTLASTRHELEVTFQACFVSAEAAEFVLRQMPLAAAGSRAEVDSSFAKLLEADLGLKERMNRWLAAVNEDEVASMKARVDIHVAQMPASMTASTDSKEAKQAWEDDTRYVLESFLPPSIIPEDLTAVLLKQRGSSAHVREAALMSALRVAHALRHAEDATAESFSWRSASLRGMRQRLEVAIEQRWLEERDPSILALLKSNATDLTLELGLLGLREPVRREPVRPKPVSASLPPSIQQRAPDSQASREKPDSVQQVNHLTQAAVEAKEKAAGTGLLSQIMDILSGLRGSLASPADSESAKTGTYSDAKSPRSRPATNPSEERTDRVSLTPKPSARRQDHSPTTVGRVTLTPKYFGLADEEAEAEDNDDLQDLQERLKVEWLSEPHGWPAEPLLPPNLYSKVQKGAITIDDLRKMICATAEPFPKLRAAKQLQRYSRGFVSRHKTRILRSIRHEQRRMLEPITSYFNGLHLDAGEYELNDNRTEAAMARRAPSAEELERLLGVKKDTRNVGLLASAGLSASSRTIADQDIRPPRKEVVTLVGRRVPMEEIINIQLSSAQIRDAIALESTDQIQQQLATAAEEVGIAPPLREMPPSPPPSPPPLSSMQYTPSLELTVEKAATLGGQLLMSAMHRLDSLTVQCLQGKADLERWDAHLLSLRKRSVEVQRMREWILADPTRILNCARTNGDGPPGIDRDAVLHKLRQFNSTSIPDADLHELASTLMAGAQNMAAKQLQMRLATDSQHAKEVAERRYRADGQQLSLIDPDVRDSVKFEFTTRHHMEAISIVASMQSHVSRSCAQVLEALRLKQQVLLAPDSMLSHRNDKGVVVILERRELRAFVEQIDERLRVAELANALNIVREWAGMLRGYVSIRRGGCFRISSESVWQSGLRRLNKHHQSQKDKLRERLFMVSRSSQRDAEDARSDALSTTHSSDGQDSLTKHSKFFVRTEAVVIKPLPDDCVLEIGIEYCVARRPSRNGSLMGSSQAYVDHCTKLKALVEEMLGGDTSNVHFVVNEPGLIAFDLQPQQHAFGTGSLSAAGTVRPASANLIRRGSLGIHTDSAAAAAAFTPRLGSFEVAILLRSSGEVQHCYGPLTIFSKLAEGRWPYHSALAPQMRSRVQQLVSEHLNRLLPAGSGPRPLVEHGMDANCNPGAETEASEQEGALGSRKASWKAAWEVLGTLSPVPSPAHHQFVVHIEYCTEMRPSLHGLNRFFSHTYADHFEHLKELVQAALPSATIAVNFETVPSGRDQTDEQPVEAHAPSKGVSLSLPKSVVLVGTLRSAKQNQKQLGEHSKQWHSGGGRGILDRPHKLINAPAERFSRKPSVVASAARQPRSGAFEVSVTLLGPMPNTRYGPVQVFSKLESGKFPVHDQVIRDLHACAMDCIMAAEKPGGSLYQQSASAKLIS